MGFEKILSLEELKREAVENNFLFDENNMNSDAYKPYYKGMKFNIPYSAESKVAEDSHSILHSITNLKYDARENAHDFPVSKKKSKKKKLTASEKARRKKKKKKKKNLKKNRGKKKKKKKKKKS